MTDLIKNQISTLRKITNSDFSCVIKFENDGYDLISASYSDEIQTEPRHIHFSKGSDISDLYKMIEEELNLLSTDSNYFISGNIRYYVFIGSLKQNFFNPVTKVIFDEFIKNLEQIILSQPDLLKNSQNENNDFQILANSSNELVFYLDQSGMFTFINQYGFDVLKYTEEEMLGTHIFEIVGDEFKGIIGQSFQKIINNKCEDSIKIDLIPKVSVEQTFKLKLIPIFNGEKLDRVLGIGNNISKQNSDKKKIDDLNSKLKEANRINIIERDRAKQQISILSELNNLKNEFISNVSHELRTPLASIIGFSETILEDKDLTIDKAKDFNNVIIEESKRLAKLINDVIDFSELENEKQKLEKRSLNIIQVLKNNIEQISEQCKQKNITLTDNLPESEIIILADEERLFKAFNYILSNAVKFTNENGRITVIAQEFLKEVELIFSDTGIGISEHKIPTLFDKFSKVKRAGYNLPGAGFGLVTVKQIIDLHKGIIRVKSEVDQGTSFIIKLPKFSFN